MAKAVKMTIRMTVEVDCALTDCVDTCNLIIKHDLEFNPVQKAEVLALAMAGGVTKEDLECHAGAGLLYGIRYEAQRLLDKRMIESMTKE